MALPEPGKLADFNFDWKFKKWSKNDTEAVNANLLHNMRIKMESCIFELILAINRHIYWLLLAKNFQSDLIWRNMKWKCSTGFDNLESDIFLKPLKHLFWFLEFSAEFLFFLSRNPDFTKQRDDWFCSIWSNFWHRLIFRSLILPEKTILL